MKINQVDTKKNTNFRIFNKMNIVFLEGKVKIKTLLKDVFEKNSKGKDSIMKNDKKIASRFLPNSITGEEEVYNGRGGVIRYFQEDIEKMKTMTAEEIIKFKRQLRKENKYYEE